MQIRLTTAAPLIALALALAGLAAPAARAEDPFPVCVLGDAACVEDPVPFSRSFCIEAHPCVSVTAGETLATNGRAGACATQATEDPVIFCLAVETMPRPGEGCSYVIYYTPQGSPEPVPRGSSNLLIRCADSLCGLDAVLSGEVWRVCYRYDRDAADDPRLCLQRAGVPTCARYHDNDGPGRVVCVADACQRVGVSTEADRGCTARAAVISGGDRSAHVPVEVLVCSLAGAEGQAVRVCRSNRSDCDQAALGAETGEGCKRAWVEAGGTTREIVRSGC